MVSHSQNKTQTLYQGPGGQFSLRQLLQPVLMLLLPYYIPTRLAAFLLLQYALLPQGLGTCYFLSLPITYLHPGFHSWFLLKLQISSEVSPPQVIQQLLNKMNRSITFYYFSSNDCKLSLSSLFFFLASLLLCISGSRYRLCLTHCCTLGPSVVLGTWHGHSEFLQKGSVSHPRLLNVLILNDN